MSCSMDSMYCTVCVFLREMEGVWVLWDSLISLAHWTGQSLYLKSIECSRVEIPMVATVIEYWQCLLWKVGRCKLPEKDVISQCLSQSAPNLCI